MKTTVTVVIPAYNMSRFVGQALDSLLGQTFQDWSAIVVDDCSQDDTAEVVQEHRSDRVRYIRQPQNLGLPSARNRAMTMADSPYISFLDADDFFPPWTLEEELSVMERCPQVGLVSGQAYLVDAAGKTWGIRKPFRSRDLLIFSSDEAVRVLLRRNPITFSTVMVRRRCLQTGSDFDPGLRSGSEDRDWLLRLAARESMAYIPQPLVYYRVHGGSMTASRSTQGAIENGKRLIERFFSEADIPSRYGHLKRGAYADLYYTAAVRAAERRLRRQAVVNFMKAGRLAPLGWLGRNGLLFAYALSKSLAPGPLFRRARQARWSLARRRWQHGGGLHTGRGAAPACGRRDSRGPQRYEIPPSG